MGARGPLPDPSARRRGGKAMTPARVTASVPTHPETIPNVPEGMGDAGLAAWEEAWSCEWALMSDARAIEHLARLEDERAAMLVAIGNNLVLEKAQVTPRGEVVGEELYANPLLRDLRRLDGPIQVLRDRLGLTPLARARLGQAVVQLRKDERALERERIMNSYRDVVQEG